MKPIILNILFVLLATTLLAGETSANWKVKCKIYRLPSDPEYKIDVTGSDISTCHKTTEEYSQRDKINYSFKILVYDQQGHLLGAGDQNDDSHGIVNALATGSYQHHWTFPLKVRGDKSFEDGGGADWVIDITISNNGKIDMFSNIKAHSSFNGWCGRFAVYLLDEDGNNLGRYGMGEDHSWCVNGRKMPAGPHERNDEIHQDIPKDVLPNIAKVAVQQVSAPTGKFSFEDAKKIAKDILK